jgi:PPOX class probable F420-dependent enzyme
MPFSRLGSEKYILLTTFRRDGSAVSTPIWFALDGPRLVAFTGAQTGKVKRIRNTSRVMVSPCSFRGRVTGQVWHGHAKLLPDAERDHVMGLIRRKYRVTKFLLDMTVGAIRMIARKPQTHSVCLEIRLVEEPDGAPSQ